MQTTSIWDRKFDWDKFLPDNIKSKWYDLLEDLQKAVTREVLRFYFTNEISTKINIKIRKLHLFTDASQSANMRIYCERRSINAGYDEKQSDPFNANYISKT